MKPLLYLLLLCVTVAAQAPTNLYNITLGWNPEPEPDFIAYQLWEAVGSPETLPQQFVKVAEFLTTEINMAAPTYTLQGYSPESSRTFMLCTKDSLGFTSAFSEPVTIKKAPKRPGKPRIEAVVKVQVTIN